MTPHLRHSVDYDMDEETATRASMGAAMQGHCADISDDIGSFKPPPAFARI
jgi:hypothetical protein